MKFIKNLARPLLLDFAGALGNVSPIEKVTQELLKGGGGFGPIE